MVKSPISEEPRSAFHSAPPTSYQGGQKSDKSPNRLMSNHYRHLFDQMLELLREGASLRAAAGVIGVELSTVQHWLAKSAGQHPNTGYARFRKAITQAQMQARSAAECHIRKRDPKAWLQANAADTWHPEQQKTSIHIDNRSVAFIEQADTGDLAKTLACLEELGLTHIGGGAAPDDKQDDNVIDAQSKAITDQTSNESPSE